MWKYSVRSHLLLSPWGGPPKQENVDNEGFYFLVCMKEQKSDKGLFIYHIYPKTCIKILTLEDLTVHIKCTGVLQEYLRELCPIMYLQRCQFVAQQSRENEDQKKTRWNLATLCEFLYLIRCELNHFHFFNGFTVRN